MRNAFAQELVELADIDERVVLLSGDIGNRLFDPFKDKFAERIFNCGVAEANMTGVAAGMAIKGLRPITYSIAAFNTLRCLEQIRVDLCYHNLPVIVVGVGAGLSYASLGYTHHANEDIAILRTLPNMTVICPADPMETRSALRAALALDGPVYLRIGKKGEDVVHAEPPDLKIGRGYQLRDGSDICLLSVGIVLPEVLAAADALEEQGHSVKIVSLHTVKPLDEELLAKVFSEMRAVVCIEEHSAIGGAGSAIAEWLVRRESVEAQFIPIALADSIPHQVQSTASARIDGGLDAPGLTETITAALGRRQ